MPINNYALKCQPISCELSTCGGLVAGRVCITRRFVCVYASVIVYPCKYINSCFRRSRRIFIKRAIYYTKACHTLSWIDASRSTDSTNLLLKLSETSGQRLRVCFSTSIMLQCCRISGDFTYHTAHYFSVHCTRILLLPIRASMRPSE